MPCCATSLPHSEQLGQLDQEEWAHPCTALYVFYNVPFRSWFREPEPLLCILLFLWLPFPFFATLQVSTLGSVSKVDCLHTFGISSQAWTLLPRYGQHANLHTEQLCVGRQRRGYTERVHTACVAHPLHRHAA